jgi:hypothetical protein
LVLTPKPGCRLVLRGKNLELLEHSGVYIAVSADLEDAIRGWHLQDQVSIVGNCHKLIQGWPAHNGIEGEADHHDIKQDTLCVELLRHPECDREEDTTTQHNRHRAQSREWA